ncbi:MAG: HPr family phosphocarrier protein [Deltaproteobacteria bacterium]|jgi:phosphocarrier protein|nr:HPr family phosphocarrier protein [Deltaproteobacteria bacterium]
MLDLEIKRPNSLSTIGDSPASKITVKIKNRLGLHGRAAGKLVTAAKPFRSKLFLVRDDRRADVRSIMSLLTLECPYNTEVSLIGIGEDAEEAITVLAKIINDRFGEA